MVHAAWLATGGVAALLLADRLLLLMEARGWIYWRKRKGLSSIGVDFMQEGDPGAQPVRRAVDQERVRKNVRPAEEPPVQLDLDAGIVRIRHPDPAPPRPKR
jgi:hypothetical protein